MKIRYLIAAGTLSFIVGILVQAPAALLYGWIAPRAALPVSLLGVNGTLPHGSAAQVRHGRQVVAADIDWTLKPLSLLLAQLSYQLHSDSPPLMLDGRVSQRFGTTTFSQLSATGELRTLAAAAGQAFVPVNGALNLDLAELQLRDNWPASATGSLQINNLEWALGKTSTPLGNYQILLSTEDDQIVARISSLSGSVEIAGDARLMPDRSYSYTLKLKPKADAPPLVANLMKQLGQPDNEGYYSLNASGIQAISQSGETPAGSLAPMAIPSSTPPPSSQAEPSKESEKRAQERRLGF